MYGLLRVPVNQPCSLNVADFGGMAFRKSETKETGLSVVVNWCTAMA